MTHLGAFPTVAALVTATAVLLAVRGRYAEIVVLVAGLVLVYIAVNVTKEAIDRPRPTGSLVATPATPTRVVTLPMRQRGWRGDRLTRRLRLVTSSALVFVALGIAAAVGLSRVYLRAHWWSDVAGGWGLGAGIFACSGQSSLSSSTSATIGSARRRDFRRGRELMQHRAFQHTDRHRAGRRADVACYVALVLVPATRCYGRVWEKLPRES